MRPQGWTSSAAPSSCPMSGSKAGCPSAVAVRAGPAPGRTRCVRVCPGRAARVCPRGRLALSACRGSHPPAPWGSGLALLLPAPHSCLHPAPACALSSAPANPACLTPCPTAGAPPPGGAGAEGRRVSTALPTVNKLLNRVCCRAGAGGAGRPRGTGGLVERGRPGGQRYRGVRIAGPGEPGGPWKSG